MLGQTRCTERTHSRTHTHTACTDVRFCTQNVELCCIYCCGYYYVMLFILDLKLFQLNKLDDN